MKATKEITYNKTHNLKVEGQLVEKKAKTSATKKIKKPSKLDLILTAIQGLDKRLSAVETEMKVFRADNKLIKDKIGI